MANPTTEGNAAWGVQNGVTGVANGITTDLEISHEGQLANELNEVGAVVRVTKYDVHYSLNATIEVPAGTEPPEPGQTISVDGKTYMVETARVTESNQAYRKIVVTASRWTNFESQASNP